jgi:hypothetical protein
LALLLVVAVALIAWLSWPSRVVVQPGTSSRDRSSPTRPSATASDRLVVHVVEEHHEALPIWHSVKGAISVLHVV